MRRINAALSPRFYSALGFIGFLGRHFFFLEVGEDFVNDRVLSHDILSEFDPFKVNAEPEGDEDLVFEGALVKDLLDVGEVFLELVPLVVINVL